MEKRIRTTHVGSLPRPEPVTTQLTAREAHGFADGSARREFDAVIASAVTDVVRRQVDVGIDLVSDGEMSKIAYSTYVKDRLTNFDGDTPRKPALDLAPYDELRHRLAAAAGGAQSFKRQSCVGPIEYVGQVDVEADLAHLGAAVESAGLTPADAFLNAASPGLVTAFQGNEFFPTHEAYVEAVGDAMREEYEAIVGAGFSLQLDCPDLAMARHTGFQDLDVDQFLRRAAHHVEVLNHATRNIDPASMRMHLCWGNYEGPHDHDIDLDLVLPIVLRARPAHILFEAANPRHAHEWQVWAEADIPDDKVLVPGVVTSTSNYVEHPRHVAELIGRYVAIVGRDRVIAGTDCGFGTFAGIGKIDPDVAYKKLAALVAGAELASASTTSPTTSKGAR
ncbi:MAG: cobalamin-independent methionine synthase II family protein [Actinobacteria bacterium]|nr:cobalamin-independent methionine synthase II family protein [Actinomycetota bacterium]